MHRFFFLLVLSCWFALAASFQLRKRPPAAHEARRGRGRRIGLLLQGLSVGIVWALPRPMSASPGDALDWALAVVAVSLAAGSAWMMVASERALGRQFAYQARLVEGHQLVTSGPYRFVRHPIYTALFGLVLATALVWSRWVAIPAFLPLFVAGTLLRVRSEERLLRDAFGPRFDDYARRVPAVIPRLL